VLDTILKEAFPSFIWYCLRKGCFYWGLGGFFRVSIQWNVSFARAAHGWEVEAFAIVFSENKTGRGRQAMVGPSFGVKSFYSVMGCHDGFR